MNKQEEIREEVEILIRACLLAKGMDASISDALSKALILLLNGLGVVIKVERELPSDGQFRDEFVSLYENLTPEDFELSYEEAYDEMGKFGYVAVEPLIGEK